MCVRLDLERSKKMLILKLKIKMQKRQNITME